MNRITVGEIHEKHVPGFKSVAASTSVDTVVRTFAANTSVQCVFVVEDDGQLIGAINRLDLLRWVAVKIIGGEASRSLSVGNIRRILFAADAGDLARRTSAVPTVSLDTDLDASLRLMMDSGEPVLPVVDADGRLVGDLRVSEILAAALDSDESARTGAGARAVDSR